MSKVAESLRLAAAYAAAVFCAGFVLGTVRVLIIAPRIGIRASELLELPVMVGASFVVAGWVNRRLGLTASVTERLAIGAAALLLLLAAEAATAVALRGVSLRDALVNPDPVSGPLYYFSLLLFGIFPAVRGRRRPPLRNR